MKDLVPIKPLSARSTQSHRTVSRDQPDERLYTAREVEHELRKYPTRKYKAVCVVILRRSRRAPRVHYGENGDGEDNRRQRSMRLTSRDLPSLKRLWTEDDDEYGRPLKRVLGKQTSRRRGPIDSGRGKRMVGGRVYDSKLGTSCHQCRQKTTAAKVVCRRPGCGEMFDVECLEVRYNDRKSDALRPDWRCPVCQGTCNCSFCRPKKGLPSTGPLAHKAQKCGYYSASHYLGDVIVNADGTWKVAPQAAKFRYREKGDVSEDEQAEEDPEEVDELEDDESEKVDDSGRDEEEKADDSDRDEEEKVDELDEEEEEKVDELDEEEEKVDELDEEEEKVDELDEDGIDELAEEENAPVKNIKSPKTASKEDAKSGNILRARKTDANAVTSMNTEKSAVEGKEDKAKVESKNKVSN
ncbi:hypothetical protein BG000_001621 [Podila horticola]|nr:hypothetical protein BG000_001621 [Podila horticola]